MKDYAIIIPLHILDDEVKTLLKKAMQSVISQDPNVEIFISSTEKILNKLKDDESIEKFTPIIVNDNETGFCSQVNNFAKNCNYKWFSILEYDDQYSSIWFKNFELYSSFHDDVSVFMPLTELYDFNSNNLVSLANEIVWATSFSEEVGFVDAESLDVYSDYNLTGSFINTFDFNEIGGLKTSMKISFWNEFLMRSAQKEKKIFVIPKIGYLHFLEREGSLSDLYTKAIDEEEAKWWINLAKTECYFTEDRNRQYIPENKEKISDLK